MRITTLHNQQKLPDILCITHLWPGSGLHLGDGKSQICSRENSKLVMASSATKFF